MIFLILFHCFIFFVLLFYFSTQQNYRNTASDCCFKADSDSANLAYNHGHPAMLPRSTANVDQLHGPVVDADTGRRCRDGHRMTPTMLQQSNRNKQLVNNLIFRDGGSASSSPSSTNSCIQTPVVSDTSKDSSMSEELQRLLPCAQTSADQQLDLSLENDAGSLNSVRMGGQLAHCSSETNLVFASGSQPQTNQSSRTSGAVVGGRQVVGGAAVPVSAEHVQQLRRRSRSAENLSCRHRPKASSASWSAVDIDIGAHTESTVTDREQQMDVQQQLKQSSTGQKSVDSLPEPFTTTRLRPFRQQMNSVVVSFHCW